MVFTDEWGGGVRPRCRESDPKAWGADAIFDIVDRKLHFRSYYKPPAPQSDLENCVAHNGSMIPVPGRDIMVQGWYQGGISVFDFTDSANPVEIAFFDRGPIDANQLVLAGHWSAYWNNGFVYGSEIGRGVDVLRLKPSEFLSENEIAAAELVRTKELNTQRQRRVAWPETSVVARAYLDQLGRKSAISRERADAAGRALDRADQGDKAAASELDALASELKHGGGAGSAENAVRFDSLAHTLEALAAKLR